MDKSIEFVASIKKCLVAESSPSLAEFSNFALVFKQVVALVLAIVFAQANITGLTAMLAFLAIANLGLLAYSKRYISIDEEEIENYKVFSESLFPSFAMFILVWTIAHTLLFATNK